METKLLLKIESSKKKGTKKNFIFLLIETINFETASP